MSDLESKHNIFEEVLLTHPYFNNTGTLIKLGSRNAKRALEVTLEARFLTFFIKEATASAKADS